MIRNLNITEKNGAFPGTILFLHGIASSSRVFEEVMNSDKLPYRLVSFDLPGHGLSFRSENPYDYSLENYRKRIFKVLEGSDEVLLVGNSLGGHLALDIANEVEGLKGVVIFGAPPLKRPLNAEEAFLPQPVVQYYFTENVSDAQLDEAMQVAVQNRSVESLLKEDFRSCDPKVRSMLGAELVNFRDQATTFKELDVPRFIFQGRQEPTVNPAYINSLCAESRGRAEIVDVPNCGHYTSLEQPQFFTEKLAEIARQTLLQDGPAVAK